MMRQGMRWLGVVVGMLVAAATWAPGVAQAVPVTFEFSGMVTSAPPSVAAIGDTFSGSFTYETSTFGSYEDSQFIYRGAITNLNYTVGSSSGYNAIRVGGLPYVSVVNDSGGFDSFRVVQTVAGTSVNGYSPDLIALDLRDPSGSMFSSGALPTDLIIPEFSLLRLFVYSTDSGSSIISSSVTSITRVSSVPEPSSLLLLGSGLAGVVLFRRKLAA